MTNVTQPTAGDVTGFLAAVPHERRRAEAIELNRLFSETTGAEAVLWGPSMVGFGRRSYRYESGRSGEIFAVGFAPRKTALVLYGLTDDHHADLLDRLGPHTVGKACLYVKRLAELDRDVLTELVRRSFTTNNDASPPGTVG